MVKADTAWGRLRGLLGKRHMSSDEGLWVIPSQGVHTVGMLFPIDAIYLDEKHRVIEVVEGLSPFSIGPLRRTAASVIELPPRSVQSSHTQKGDQLLICTASEMAEYLNRRNTQKLDEPTSEHGMPDEEVPSYVAHHETKESGREKGGTTVNGRVPIAAGPKRRVRRKAAGRSE